MSRSLLRCTLTLVVAWNVWGCSPEGTTASSGPPDPSMPSLDEDDAKRIYYQFTDEKGRVRFVPTLSDVPSDWRSRVGFVEMSSPPPTSPADAKRIRDQRMASIQIPATRPSAAVSEGAAGSSGVIIYSADWCPACTSAKNYMNKQGIDYDERNVDEAEWKKEMQAKAGPGGIPVFDVNGQILRGFSPQRLDELIEQTS